VTLQLVQTAALVNVSWSATSTGALNHYIYVGDEQHRLVVGARNDGRWYFKAPQAVYARNMAIAYTGTLSFWLGAFAGDFDTPALQYQTAASQPFVALVCASCAGGTGVTLAQRDIVYRGGLDHFSFPLVEGDDGIGGNGWRVDPKDARVTDWALATQCELVQVLAGLSDIHVYGDFTTQYEAIGIDAFAITTTSDATAGHVPLACY
jgi:hypothetical protein